MSHVVLAAHVMHETCEQSGEKSSPRLGAFIVTQAMLAACYSCMQAHAENAMHATCASINPTPCLCATGLRDADGYQTPNMHGASWAAKSTPNSQLQLLSRYDF